MCSALVILLLITAVADRVQAAPAPTPAPVRPWPRVAVRVEEPDGIERVRWPLGFSVPFPAGQLRDDAPVHVVDDRGTAAPVQRRVLAHWPDGSVRWLRVDTEIDLTARQRRTVYVVPGVPGPPRAAVKAVEHADRVEIDTGAVRFAVPKQRFAVVEHVRVPEERTVAGPMRAFLAVGDRVAYAGAPVGVTVKEAGPLRASIEVRGTYGNDFDYRVRVDAYAGQPLIHVWHTFVNRAPAPYTSVSRVGVEMPVHEVQAAEYAFGVNGTRAVTAAFGSDGVRLYQPDNETYAVDGARREGRLAGWAELRGKAATMGLAARWFWQEYPQGMELRRDRFVYDFWAPEAEPAKAGTGAAKTHEFVLWAALPGGVAPAAAAGMARPLVGVVDAAWIAHSGALPDALAPDGGNEAFIKKVEDAAGRYLLRNGRERWDDCGEVRCDGIGFDRPRVGAYGMWNWGDWNFPTYEDTIKGTDTWGNLEYDTAQVLALAFAGSGRSDLYEAMVAAARHFMDVDTIHFYAARPEWVGMNHPKNPLHFAFELGGPDLGHTWTQGMVSYFYLTGDDRGLEAARGIADYLARRVQSEVRGNPRQWGWPQIALLAVYDASGERRYLDAARAYAAGGMKAHAATGSTQWKLGILADAMAYTHAVTRDGAIETWLRQYVAAVMRRKAREDARAFPAVAYVARLSGDPALRAAALARAERLDLGSWGKPFTINGRIGFRIYSLLAGARPAATPAVARRGPSPVTTSRPR